MKTQYDRIRAVFINKNNWKLVLIITFRNRQLRRRPKAHFPGNHALYHYNIPTVSDLMQISSKTQLFGPEKNFAARAPLASTSKLYYKSFTYKEKERKQERNRFHILCLNSNLFCPKLHILTYASSCNREKLTFQLFRQFRWLMIKTSFNCFY